MGSGVVRGGNGRGGGVSYRGHVEVFMPHNVKDFVRIPYCPLLLSFTLSLCFFFFFLFFFFGCVGSSLLCVGFL